ncbi:GNAT family N-acetyltransferase [Colwellia psychrerythraea]|uniref:GCN5-related N-acetyltransferase n=1 Tax=Colwellia psychrerythraea TaxID=28229 RepID=A0A099KHH0_COLPS|nr:GNAT family N-acetyltransferase [Colwellia psychrerythraea]KGJ89690.1 GCN5-related N-acetyltransferase [Colwellia psychrerythraea]
MHSFTTERLLIRPLSIQDKALFINLYTDAKVMRNIAAPLSDEKAEKAFNNTLSIMNKAQPKIMSWAIVNIIDNRAIGIQGFTWSPMKNGPLSNTKPSVAEIGIMLLRSSSGKLLPEEAIGSLIEYGFKHLKLEQINACFTKENLATARVSKKAGFVCNLKENKDEPGQRIESVFKNNWLRSYIKL